MPTIIRETYRNNVHYYLVLAGQQPLGVYADNGDKTWDPGIDRYLGPASRDDEFKNQNEPSLIMNSTVVKQQIRPQEVIQHVLNALKAAIKNTAEDGTIVWVGRGKQRYRVAEFVYIQTRAQKYFDKNVKVYRELVFSFSKAEEADACRSAIAALTKKGGNPYIIGALKERLMALDVSERMKHEDRPIVR